MYFVHAPNINRISSLWKFFPSFFFFVVAIFFFVKSLFSIFPDTLFIEWKAWSKPFLNFHLSTNKNNRWEVVCVCMVCARGYTCWTLYIPAQKRVWCVCCTDSAGSFQFQRWISGWERESSSIKFFALMIAMVTNARYLWTRVCGGAVKMI